jgi:hypothetical protein
MTLRSFPLGSIRLTLYLRNEQDMKDKSDLNAEFTWESGQGAAPAS